MAKKSNTWLYVLLGAAVVAGLSWWQSDNIVSISADAVDWAEDALKAGNAALFKASLPSYAQQYSDIILQVASEQSDDPFMLFAIGDQESTWGTNLTPKGPGGTGDSGHGRGLMQIDDRSFGPDSAGVGSGNGWLAANDWTDPYTNVTQGAKILNQAISFFSGNSAIKGITDGSTVTLSASAMSKRKVTTAAWPDPRPLSDDALAAGALAAYNTGSGNVLMNIACGLSPDFTTTGSDYSASVTDKLATAQTAYANASDAATPDDTATA